MILPPEALRLVRLALAEDLGSRGDLTTRLFLPPARLRVRVVAKEPGVFCGGAVAAAVFRLAAPGSKVRPLVREGAAVKRGRAVLEVSGPRSVLSGERTALNFLSRLSGVATLTRHYVDAVRGTGAAVYDTRKTTPGWRWLEKYAVRCGGGRNHRMGLYDAVMVKENHLDALSAAGALGSLASRVARFRRGHPGVPVIFEARGEKEIAFALSCRPDVLLLDNIGPAQLRTLLPFIRRRAPSTRIEVSGGVRLTNIRAFARLGVDRISVGRLTHSAPALDLSLELAG